MEANLFRIKPFSPNSQSSLPKLLYHCITGSDGKELTDRCIDLRFFWPANKTNLEDQLLYATSLKMRLSLLNNFVLQLAAYHHLSVNKNIIFATQTIRNGMGLIPLKNIQAELHITERSFQRLFEFHVGVSFIRYIHTHFARTGLSPDPVLPLP